MTTKDEIDHEIAQYLARTDLGPASFVDIIGGDNPSAMRSAEVFLRRRGLKMREVTGALRARNFTIPIQPLYAPSDQWKMVQTNVAVDDPGKPRKVWIKLSAANGRHRVQMEREVTRDLDEAKRLAVSNAWQVAKEIKRLPMTAPESALRAVVEKHFRKMSVDKSISDIV